MESKIVILSVLIMSLLMAQIQVEASKDCCPNITARNTFNVCRLLSLASTTCAAASGCKLVDGSCPPGYLNGDLENSGDAVNEYCKLGCVFSVCDAITTLQSSDESEIVNGAVEQCTNACSTVCTKGSISTPGTAA